LQKVEVKLLAPPLKRDLHFVPTSGGASAAPVLSILRSSPLRRTGAVACRSRAEIPFAGLRRMESQVELRRSGAPAFAIADDLGAVVVIAVFCTTTVIWQATLPQVFFDRLVDFGDRAGSLSLSLSLPPPPRACRKRPSHRLCRTS
jgi:hypothetical protein